MQTPNKTNSIIIWEKWVDPFGQNMDSVEWPGYDQIDNDDMENDPISNKKITKIHAISTSMGIIPYNEHTDCSKIFNFWIGHTNFNLTSKVVTIIEDIEGVETLDIFTRYRFRVSFGKAFNDREIMNTIANTVYSYLGTTA
jgi:hypothetical protein